MDIFEIIRDKNNQKKILWKSYFNKIWLLSPKELSMF